MCKLFVCDCIISYYWIHVLDFQFIWDCFTDNGVSLVQCVPAASSARGIINIIPTHPRESRYIARKYILAFKEDASLTN